MQEDINRRDDAEGRTVQKAGIMQKGGHYRWEG